MIVKRVLLALAFLTLCACGEVPKGANAARIVVMGDSLFAANRFAGADVADQIEAAMGEPVMDRAVPGARVLRTDGPLSIPAQRIETPVDWVVLNGYGNDVILGCGCGACGDKINRIISADGQSGAIPNLVRDLRGTGARVIYSGYLRSPGFVTPVEACGPVGDQIDARIALLAATDAGVTFVSQSDIVPNGDRSFHGIDLIHPSIKGSAAIAARIVAVIRAAER